MNIDEKPLDCILFWGGIYSQWHRAHMTIDGINYTSAEQYMMAQKALCFQDADSYNRIMQTQDPSKQKAIGREIPGYSDAEWHKIARLVVYRGNLAKFSQNDTLFNELLSSGEKVIVEASPYDKIWGIGLGENDPDAFYRSRWRGTNWLGEAIMQVRSDLRSMGFAAL